VAVDRGGGCSFGEKAIVVQSAGAVGCIIMNTSPGGIMRLMATPEQSEQVTIPVYMVSDKARDELHSLARKGQQIMGKLNEEDVMIDKGYDPV